MLVSVQDHQEFIIPGMKCKVEMPTEWIGAASDKNTVLCPAYISNVNHKEGIPSSFNVTIISSPKLKNSSVKNMLILSKQFDTVYIDIHKL